MKKLSPSKSSTKFMKPSVGNGAANFRQNLLHLFFIGAAFIWLLAVIKVFLLENTTPVVESITGSVQNLLDNSEAVDSNTFKRKVLIKKYSSRTDLISKKIELSEDARLLVAPMSSEWDVIRGIGEGIYSTSLPSLMTNPEEQKIKYVHKSFNAVELPEIKQPWELEWPPVLPDGTIPPSDGIETMPIIGLKVPRFYEVKPGDDVNKVGSRVNGHETIFLMIASYRDPQCRETIASAFLRMDYPERLYIGAVDQTVDGDTGCLDIDIPCEVDASHPVCKFRDQISIYHMDASMSTGPVTARHIGDRMYRGQYFVMQMDAHCQFVRHWDTYLIDQWKSTGNEMAVLRYVISP